MDVVCIIRPLVSVGRGPGEVFSRPGLLSNPRPWSSHHMPRWLYACCRTWNLRSEMFYDQCTVNSNIYLRFNKLSFLEKFCQNLTKISADSMKICLSQYQLFQPFLLTYYPTATPVINITDGHTLTVYTEQVPRDLPTPWCTVRTQCPTVWLCCPRNLIPPTYLCIGDRLYHVCDRSTSGQTHTRRYSTPGIVIIEEINIYIYIVQHILYFIVVSVVLSLKNIGTENYT